MVKQNVKQMKKTPLYPFIPQVLDIVCQYNDLYPHEFLSVVQQEKDIFVVRFGYYEQPTLLQEQRLREYFSTVEVIEMPDDNCGLLYPIFCKYKPV